MELLDLFESKYQEIKIQGFDSRYLPYSKLKHYLDTDFPDKILLGHSFLGKEIYALKIGNGPIKVLAWSQMHGNEATGTRAMFDVISFLKLKNEWTKSLLNSVSFYFVPMLNPDGATQYWRRNSCGIDLNRDFLQEASVEIEVLKDFVKQLQADFLFNLHDQRSIFNVGDTPKAATMAFLAPSPDEQRSCPESRVKSMAIIDHIYQKLSKVIPGHISRFTDEFYPTSTGDNFMKQGYSTILFEAGHFPDDYQRDKVRKFNALSILLALDKIQSNQSFEVGDYLKIPENKKKFLDIILRNVQLQSVNSSSVTDIGIYFEERLNVEQQEIQFCMRIEEIGDLSTFFGHLDLDMEGSIYQGKSGKLPKVGDWANFTVGNLEFIEGSLKA